MGTDIRRMTVITESAAEGRSIFVATFNEGPLVRGHGKLSYQCGTCGKTLLSRIEYKAFRDLVFKCHCGSHNEIPKTHHSN